MESRKNSAVSKVFFFKRGMKMLGTAAIDLKCLKNNEEVLPEDKTCDCIEFKFSHVEEVSGIRRLTRAVKRKEIVAKFTTIDGLPYKKGSESCRITLYTQGKYLKEADSSGYAFPIKTAVLTNSNTDNTFVIPGITNIDPNSLSKSSLISGGGERAVIYSRR